MPVSAQEHRVRTGLYRSCKGVWLSRQKTNHFPQTAETRSKREVAECDMTYLQMMWFLVTVMLLVPLMYTAFIVAMTILELLLQIRLSTDKGVVHDVSHQARLDLSWVIDVYHLVIKICSWLVQHRRMVTLFSLLCVFLISTVTAVVCLIIRHRYNQTLHRVVIVLQGRKIGTFELSSSANDRFNFEVQKVSTGHSSQRLMCVSLLVAILTAILISLMLIKSGDVELNPGPVTVLTIDSHLLPIKDAIWEARSHWKEIGRRLGLTEGDINGIHEVYDGECLHQVLSLWIHTGRASIHDLLAVLEHKTVNQTSITKKIHALRGKERKDVGLDIDEETVQIEVQGTKRNMSQMDETTSTEQSILSEVQANSSPLPPTKKPKLSSDITNTADPTPVPECSPSTSQSIEPPDTKKQRLSHHKLSTVEYPVNLSDTTSTSTIRPVVLPDSEANPSTRQPHTTEPQPLSLSEDFSLVYETLYPARPNWYNLGLALKLSPPTLDSIKIDNREKTDDCLREILLTRMKKDPYMLMWREIIDALRKPSVEERKLASEIEQQYYPHCAGPSEDVIPLDEMQSALSGEPTLEELCSLPVENVWHSLGLWLGVEERKLWEIKESCQSKNSDNKVQIMFEAFIVSPVGTSKYEDFIRSLPQEKQTIVKNIFESKVAQKLDEYKQNLMIKELPDYQRKIGQELLQEKLSKYQHLVRALVKVGKREIAEDVCAKKGVSLTDYLAATDPASNPPECVVRYASYLKDSCKQMSVLPDPDWWSPMITSKQHFTNLALIERERQSSLPDAKPSKTVEYDYAHGNVDNIVDRKQSIKFEEAFLPIIDESSKESRMTILMDGAPGVGKTTITRRVRIDWANGKILQEYQLVIFVPLREVTLSQAGNHTIADLLPADDPELKAQVIQHIQKTSGANILFLFDGFDELSTQQRTSLKRTLFLDVIKGKKLHHCSVLVTSRTYASGPLKKMNRINRHVEVLGFTEEQIRDCIKQDITDEDKADQLLQMLKDRLDISSLCYIPLNCRIVLYVLQHSEELTLSDTLTQLYNLIILHTIKHHAEKIASDLKIPIDIEGIQEAKDFQKLPELVRSQLEILSQIAFSGMQEEKLVFESADLKASKDSLSLGLLNSIETFTQVGVLQYYQFLHLTIQEFLAARYIASDKMSAEDRLTFLKANHENKRFRMTLLFLAGLTEFKFLPPKEAFPGENTIDLKTPSPIMSDEKREDKPDKEKLIFLTQLHYETRASSCDWLLSSVCSNTFNMSGYSLTRFDCLVVVHFLSTTPQDHVWEVIDLSHCNITVDRYRILSADHVKKPGVPAISMTKILNLCDDKYSGNRNVSIDFDLIPPIISKGTHLVDVNLPKIKSMKQYDCSDALKLAESLVKNKSLQKMTISDANRYQLTPFHLSRNELTLTDGLELYVCPESFKLILSRESDQLQVLRFSKHPEAFQDCPHCGGSGNDAVTSLCQSIDKATNLQKIDLSHCGLCEEWMTLINSALANKTTLESVNLEGNNGAKIQSEEAQLLGRILNGIDPTKLAGSGISVERLLQGDSDLPLELVQFNLRKIPEVAHIANNLGEYLKSRVTEEHMYQEAMKNDTKLCLCYLKMLAIGPGQVGKSTFLRRLTGLMKWDIDTAEEESQPSCSTGQAEMRRVYIERSTIAVSSTGKWQTFEDDRELERQFAAITSLLKPIAKTVTAVGIKKDDIDEQTSSSTEMQPDEHSPGAPDIASKSLPLQSKEQIETPSGDSGHLPKSQIPHNPIIQPVKTEIDKLFEKFEELRMKSRDTDHPEESLNSLHVIINMTDVGGQPAFLEILPSLTIGPAMYLIFLKLVQGLKTPFPVKFRCEGEAKAKSFREYTYTSEEVIFTALSSIACFGLPEEEVQNYVGKSNGSSQKDSLALLLGTFADELEGDREKNRVEVMEEQLREQLKETTFYTEGLVEFESTSKVLFHINNKDGGQSEVEYYQILLEKLIMEKFRQYEIPTRWFMMNVFIKMLAKNEGECIVSVDDCVKFGKKIEMEEKEVKVALQFLHKYIGIVMYFPENKHLENLVICNPHVVFASITELIFNIYDYNNKRQLSHVKCDRFVETGRFSLKDIKVEPKPDLLPIDKLVKLLVHLNVAAPIPSSPDDYFLPAVLRSAKDEALALPSREDNEEELPEPLCIRFRTGFLPLGFFCAFIANLVSADNFNLLDPNQDQLQVVLKNKITFRVQGKYDITLIAWPKYCEVRISRSPGVRSDEDFCKCCPDIRKTLQKMADRVVEKMRQSSLFRSSQAYDLGFKCVHHPEADLGHKPIAVIDTKQGVVAQCVKCNKTANLSEKMTVWYSKPITFSSDMTCEDFYIWLKQNDIPNKYIQKFRDQDINGKTFLELPCDKNELCRQLECNFTIGIWDKIKTLMTEVRGTYRTVDGHYPPATDEQQNDTGVPELTQRKLLEKLDTLNHPLEFGTRLGVELKVCQQIEVKYSHPVDTGKQKYELFGYIENNSITLGITWDRIAEVLSKIDYGDLSRNIRQTCCRR